MEDSGENFSDADYQGNLKVYEIRQESVLGLKQPGYMRLFGVLEIGA